jgi:DNA-binding transcriptional ArsR family regulator
VDRKRRHGSTDHRLIRVLDHPLRLRILELATKPERAKNTPSASTLQEALAPEFDGLEIRQVAYHLARLQDAGLLPGPAGRGRPRPADS